MQELTFPFDADYIMRKRKNIKRSLIQQNKGMSLLRTKIAILGGSTTHDIKDILELFLLNYGIEAQIYESEYNQFWQDAMFENFELTNFEPDIVFIHTTSRNIKVFPELVDSPERISEKTQEIYKTFFSMWERIRDVYHCIIIQNNFEPPYYRLLGNKDVSDVHGRVNFINGLNQLFYNYAQEHEGFYINDINYLASSYGLSKWSDSFYWYMYKYALAVPAIPEFTFNVANIIKSIYGKNKKAYVLDLDNTLWGGIIGEDGANGIEIGQETVTGQMYSEFQQYIKSHKELGIMLNINSKNDYENAIAGLSCPGSILSPEDFICIKANWNTKDRNLLAIANELNISPDNMVFVDDNPAEREIVESQIEGVSVPKLQAPETYITILDRSGFFEVTNLSNDDLNRNDMYKANEKRNEQRKNFIDYNEYLLSLEMEAEIMPFSQVYMPRIAQLTNKSNQFNLTTKRYDLNDIERFASDREYITLYGKLKDKFGDNGVVSVIIGHCQKDTVHIILWLMSCRVLKREMEIAMMDALVEESIKRGIKTIVGYYYPTVKNKMVREFYAQQGFVKVCEGSNGNTMWELNISQGYGHKNKVIKVER